MTLFLSKIECIMIRIHDDPLFDGSQPLVKGMKMKHPVEKVNSYDPYETLTWTPRDSTGKMLPHKLTKTNRKTKHPFPSGHFTYEIKEGGPKLLLPVKPILLSFMSWKALHRLREEHGWQFDQALTKHMNAIDYYIMLGESAVFGRKIRFPQLTVEHQPKVTLPSTCGLTKCKKIDVL